MDFVGQEKLIGLLDNYTLATLPKTMLFIGAFGCGKHTLAKRLANKLDLAIQLIDSKITNNQLIEYYQKPIETLYLIELQNFTDKNQNNLLKFIEEPSDYAYIILLAESEANILPTILNRCTKFQFESYTKDQLLNFTDTTEDLVFKICDTPGQIKLADPESIINLFNLCKNIVTQMSKASYSNTLTIVAKLNHKEDYNKFDQNLFLKMLNYVSFEEYIKTNSDDAFKIYNLTNYFKQAKLNKNIVKENYMINFITQLWEAIH